MELALKMLQPLSRAGMDEIYFAQFAALVNSI